MFKPLMTVVVLTLGLGLSFGVAAQEDMEDIQVTDIKPTGAYDVGRMAYHWVDETREAVFASEAGEFRILPVLIWYPANTTTEDAEAPYYHKATYYYNAEMLTSYARAMYGALGIEFAVDLFAEAGTDSYMDAPVAEAGSPFPVLIFSHGFGARPEGYTSQLEELASHGYIVVAPVHTGVAGYADYGNGTVVPHTQPDPVSAQRVSAQDQVFVLDQLATLNTEEGGQFADRIDLERVGAFGNSWGAGVAGLAAQRDDRIGAVALVEGGNIVIPDEVAAPTGGLGVPALVLYRGDAQRSSREMLLSGPVYSVRFAGMTHADFITDLPLLNLPMERPEGWDGKERVETVHAYVLDFFNVHLKGEDASLLYGSSSEPSWVDFQVRNQ